MPLETAVSGLVNVPALKGIHYAVESGRLAAEAAASVDPWSPWHARDHWWLNAAFEREMPFIADGSPMPIKVRGDGLGWQLTMGDDINCFTSKSRIAEPSRATELMKSRSEKIPTGLAH